MRIAFASQMKLLAFTILLTLSALSQAASFTFEPADKDLYDLDHYDAVSWGIALNIPSDQRITNATLEIKNIYDWTQENNDILQIRLLDAAPLGVKTYYDNQATGDYFGNQGVAVGTWTDPMGGKARGVNLKFDFAQLGLVDDLTNYVKNDGKIALTFDPDCHYFNDGVKFTVHTEAVPEPATMSVLGLSALVGLRKKLKK